MRQTAPGTHRRGTGGTPRPADSRHSGTGAVSSMAPETANPGPSEGGPRWFAVQCQAHREHFAAFQLRQQGFAVFLPLRPKTWRHARRIETRHVPFFPGYLFMLLDLDRDRWRSVNGTFGVRRLVTAGGEARPVALPAGLVETLRGEADDRGCLRRAGLLRAGQAVRILAGPFGDRMGELIGLDEAGRVRVLIELLGGQIPAILSRGEVMAAR
jgi:transcription antitermination factor NusG